MIFYNILRTLVGKFLFFFSSLSIDSSLAFVSLCANINFWLSSDISAPRSSIQYFIMSSFWSSASAENSLYYIINGKNGNYRLIIWQLFLTKNKQIICVPSSTLKYASRSQFPCPLVVPFQYLHNLFGQSEGHLWSQYICMIHPKLFPTLSPS